MPMVNVVLGVLAALRPQMRHHGWPMSLPTRSWRAMSTAALAAESAGDRLSTYVRMSSIWKGSLNCERSTFCKKAVTLFTVCPR